MKENYVVSALRQLFFFNHFAVSLTSFQQVHYCYSKAVMIVPAVAVSNSFNRGTVYMKSYAKER